MKMLLPVKMCRNVSLNFKKWRPHIYDLYIAENIR